MKYPLIFKLGKKSVEITIFNKQFTLTRRCFIATFADYHRVAQFHCISFNSQVGLVLDVGGFAFDSEYRVGFAHSFNIEVWSVCVCARAQ